MINRLLVAVVTISLNQSSILPGQISLDAPEYQGHCQQVEFENSSFTQCIADPAHHHMSIRITGSNGIIYRGFAGLQKDSDQPSVAFAVNGGMYNLQGVPIGYYVENGERLYKLNRRNGAGNFHLNPNGVFFGTDGKWQVMTSDDFAINVRQRPDFGTQSGPMLVIDNEIHPKFAKNGQSQYVRNAVGVDENGIAHFVISDAPLSFGKMARFMRDKARTPNALYLDGHVSALWDPYANRMDKRFPLGPLIVVQNARKDPVT